MTTGLVSETAILVMQFAASMFMAADYFFKEKQRNRIFNRRIRRAANFVQKLIVKDNKNIWEEVSGGRFVIYLFGMICVFFLVAVIYFPGIADPILENASTRRGDAIFFLFLTVVVILLDFFIVVGFSIIINPVVFYVGAFIKRCPKGSIFGVGFVMLMASFVCRYLNLP